MRHAKTVTRKSNAVKTVKTVTKTTAVLDNSLLARAKSTATLRGTSVKTLLAEGLELRLQQLEELHAT